MKHLLLAAFLFPCLFLIFVSTHLQDASAQKLAAVSTSTYPSLEQDILKEINLARTRPAEYAAYLEQLRPLYAGKEYRRPGKPVLATEEGTVALDEAISFLRAQKPIAALALSSGMCSGARSLVTEQSASGATGHKGADGSFCEQRTQRFGAWNDPIGEDLNYSDDNARERVMTLLIDDGVANRGHRLRLLSPNYKVAGVACGNHKLGGMCVITFAGGFTDKSGPAQPQTTKKDAITTTPPAGVRRF